MTGKLIKKGDEWFIENTDPLDTQHLFGGRVRLPKEMSMRPDPQNALSDFLGVPVFKLEGLAVNYDIRQGKVCLINTLESLEQAVDDFLSPKQRFKTEAEVREFLKNAKMSELKGFLQACIKSEAYEYAEITNQIIKTKV